MSPLCFSVEIVLVSEVDVVVICTEVVHILEVPLSEVLYQRNLAFLSLYSVHARPISYSNMCGKTYLSFV